MSGAGNGTSSEEGWAVFAAVGNFHPPSAILRLSRRIFNKVRLLGY